MAGPGFTSATTSTRDTKANILSSLIRSSFPTYSCKHTRPRSIYVFTPVTNFPPNTKATFSPRSTAHGTGRNAPVTKSSASRLITPPAKREANMKISSPVSLRPTAKSGVARLESPSPRTAASFSAKTATAPSGASATRGENAEFQDDLEVFDRSDFRHLISDFGLLTTYH